MMYARDGGDTCGKAGWSTQQQDRRSEWMVTGKNLQSLSRIIRDIGNIYRHTYIGRYIAIDI